ncbi:unnamed protein product, partial [marine sediment metagenome]
MSELHETARRLRDAGLGLRVAIVAVFVLSIGLRTILVAAATPQLV